MNMIKRILSQNTLSLIAFSLGILTGLLSNPQILNAAQIVGDVSIKLMKLIAVPLLFLSIVASAGHFRDSKHLQRLGGKIFKYTLFTTFLATMVAELLYWVVAPHVLGSSLPETATAISGPRGLRETIIDLIPSSIVEMFLENNVIAVVVTAIILAIGILTVQQRERDLVFGVFAGLLNAAMNIVRVGLKILPISVWAFVTMLTEKIVNNQTESLNAVGGLTLTVITANLVQGLIILPLLLRYKGINPRTLFMQMKEALFIGFFTRSSMATIPITLERAIDHAKISPEIARLSLPLCTTINMNGCAQFILLSVYFVSAFSGHALSPWEHVGMIFLSIIAAIGNAGVPMGCFFLASSILVSNDIPLILMGSILPLYMFIDMVETSLNIWSDVSVTKIIDHEQAKENPAV